MEGKDDRNFQEKFIHQKGYQTLEQAAQASH